MSFEFDVSIVTSNLAQGNVSACVDYLCEKFGHNKRLLQEWFEKDSLFDKGEKANAIVDLFVHYTNEVPAIKQLFYAKFYEQIVEKFEWPKERIHFTINLQDIYYKAIKLQGRKKLIVENVLKTMNKLILATMEEQKVRRNNERIQGCELLMELVDGEKEDNPNMWRDSMEKLIEKLGENHVVIWKRRLYELAERISLEGLENSVTPNILDCFNETMQNYMEEKLKHKEGDVESLSKNLKLFFKVVKNVVELSDVRKKCVRKRKPKKKSTSSTSSSASDECSDEEEIVLNKQECMFCGKSISPLATYAECVECEQEGVEIQSKFQ
jgi:hypothetical protein